MTDLLAPALDYFRRDWSIIPTGKDKRPPCGFSWKRWQLERPTEADVRRWFGPDRREGVTGVAVMLGVVSGNLAVRDFDAPGAFDGWAAARPDLARVLPTVQTGRNGGRHVYFRAPGLRTIHLGDGEVRGADCYCNLPPSLHPSGAVYKWVVPLPEGPLPVIDPREAGLVPVTERRERTERTERTEENRGHSGGLVSNAATVVFSAEVERAIVESLPSGIGRRNAAVFELARAMKAIPALADADPRSLRDIVREWHRRALPCIATKRFDDTWGDFLHGWPRVRFPKGAHPMEAALAAADQRALPAAALVYDAPETRRLAGLCAELQSAAGVGVFYLSARTAGRLLFKGDHMTAWRRLRLLEADGVLLVSERGTANGRATRYRYVHGV